MRRLRLSDSQAHRDLWAPPSATKYQMLLVVICILFIIVFWFLGALAIKAKATDSLEQALIHPGQNAFDLEIGRMDLPVDSHFIGNPLLETLFFDVDDGASQPLDQVRCYRQAEGCIYYVVHQGIRCLELLWIDVSFSVGILHWSTATLMLCSIVIALVALAIQRRFRAIDKGRWCATAALFSDTTHSLKTPLATIEALAENCESGVIGGEESCLAIMGEVKKLNTVVSDLLHLGRVEEGLQHPVFISVSLNDVVVDALDDIEAQVDRKGVQLSFVVLQDSLAHCDVDLAHCVLVNLFSNAVRHAITKIEVVLSCDENWAQIKIINDGDGLSRQQSEGLFERFEPGPHGESGLGMALCAKYGRILGWKLVANPCEQGTELQVKVPLNR